LQQKIGSLFRHQDSGMKKILSFLRYDKLAHNSHIGNKLAIDKNFTPSND